MAEFLNQSFLKLKRLGAPDEHLDTVITKVVETWNSIDEDNIDPISITDIELIN